MSTLLPCYVLLDLETTGATQTQDRITEIGLIRYENGIEVVAGLRSLIQKELQSTSSTGLFFGNVSDKKFVN